MTFIDLKKLDKENIMGTYARNDMIIKSGKGSRCYDEVGNEYIDFSAGIGVNSLGFANEKWVKAVTYQAATLQHTSNLYYTEPQILLAKELVERSGMSKAFFANSGAEANEGAMKTARKYGNLKSNNEKNRIVSLYSSFHGRTMTSLTATGQDKYHQNFYPFTQGHDYCKPGDIDQLDRLLTENTCGLIMELIQGEGGVNPLDKDFVQAAAAMCKERDILLIIDEVQTGVGRTGTFFAFEQFGIEPDMVTFAKGIGGGLPLGGILFNEKAAQILEKGDHGTTYGGNPVVCAGALAVLEQITEELLSQVKEKGEYIRRELSLSEGVESVVGLGLMIGILPKEKPVGEIVTKSREKGLLVLTAGPKIRLLPPLNTPMEDIIQGTKILKQVIEE